MARHRHPHWRSCSFPLAVFLSISASSLIVGLFTDTYAASVPIFMVWVLTMLPAVMAVDAVLRVYAQTRFLLVMNLVRFVVRGRTHRLVPERLRPARRGASDAAGDGGRARRWASSGSRS